MKSSETVTLLENRNTNIICAYSFCRCEPNFLSIWRVSLGDLLAPPPPHPPKKKSFWKGRGGGGGEAVFLKIFLHHISIIIILIINIITVVSFAFFFFFRLFSCQALKTFATVAWSLHQCHDTSYSAMGFNLFKPLRSLPWRSLCWSSV